LPFLADCSYDNVTGTSGENCTLSEAFTSEQGSWIGSLFPIGALIASQLTGFLLPRIGRKWTLIVLSVPFTIGWVCLLIPGPADLTGPTLFYVGRIFTGIGAGGYALAPPIYISETAELSIRGSMGSVMQFMLTIGIAVINAMGIENAVDWVIITGICLVFPGILLLKNQFNVMQCMFMFITREYTQYSTGCCPSSWKSAFSQLVCQWGRLLVLRLVETCLDLLRLV
jgi:MFS family permease